MAAAPAGVGFGPSQDPRRTLPPPRLAGNPAPRKTSSAVSRPARPSPGWLKWGALITYMLRRRADLRRAKPCAALPRRCFAGQGLALGPPSDLRRTDQSTAADLRQALAETAQRGEQAFIAPSSFPPPVRAGMRGMARARVRIGFWALRRHVQSPLGLMDKASDL